MRVERFHCAPACARDRPERVQERSYASETGEDAPKSPPRRAGDAPKTPSRTARPLLRRTLIKKCCSDASYNGNSPSEGEFFYQILFQLIICLMYYFQSFAYCLARSLFVTEWCFASVKHMSVKIDSDCFRSCEVLFVVVSFCTFALSRTTWHHDAPKTS